MGGIIRDRIVLRGFAGTVPPEHVQVALETMLAGPKGRSQKATS